MPQEPKKRHSRQRKGKRRASIKLQTQKGILCPNCAAPTLPHIICKKCGYYKNIQMVVKKVKKEKQEEQSK